MNIFNRLVMCMDTVAVLPHAHNHRQSPYPHHGKVYTEHCVLKGGGGEALEQP